MTEGDGVGGIKVYRAAELIQRGLFGIGESEGRTKVEDVVGIKLVSVGPVRRELPVAPARFELLGGRGRLGISWTGERFQ